MYRVVTDELSDEQIAALPAAALPVYAELQTVLEISPWSSEPLNDDNPDGPVRTFTFGPTHQGIVTILILEGIRRVDVLDVRWLDFE